MQTEDMRQEAMALEQRNDDLADKISILDSVQSVEQIAQEELGMVKPDTVIINPNQ
jgi:cell division protein FtsB